MQTVTMRKDDFRKKVEENKQQHEQLFHEASTAFYERVNVKLEEIAQGVRAKKLNFIQVIEAINKLQRDHPQGYCNEYQRVLDMLEYDTREEIPLQANEFIQYVKDEWGWKKTFAASYTSNTGQQIT